MVPSGPAQVQTCDVGSRPTPGGSPAFSGESRKKERRGQAPWTPFLMARSFPLAHFGVVGRSGAIVGLLRGPSACPDLERFFRVGQHNPEASLWGEAVTEGDG